MQDPEKRESGSLKLTLAGHGGDSIPKEIGDSEKATFKYLFCPVLGGQNNNGEALSCTMKAKSERF